MLIAKLPLILALTRSSRDATCMYTHGTFMYETWVLANLYSVFKIRSADNIADVMATFKAGPNFRFLIAHAMTPAHICVSDKGHHWLDSSFD